MAYRRLIPLIALSLLLSSTAFAQLSGTPLDYRRTYTDELLYVHPLLNYAYDLEWRFDWHRRQLSAN